jgi:hypothetical protein
MKIAKAPTSKDLVSCSSDYSTRWLAIKKTFNNV